jgi:aspartyl-tRNA(Asn)/glutamyl-tRNA(Gln) amidotransferase subunit C
MIASIRRNRADFPTIASGVGRLALIAPGSTSNTRRPRGSRRWMAPRMLHCQDGFALDGGTTLVRRRELVKLSLEEVDHISMLARLGLTPEERERMRDQLSSILDHVSLLSEIDTEAIPPTAQVITLQNVMRPDEVRPSLPVETVLRNAPQTEDDMFKVNAVLEQS